MQKNGFKKKGDNEGGVFFFKFQLQKRVGGNEGDKTWPKHWIFEIFEIFLPFIKEPMHGLKFEDYIQD